MGNEGVKPAGPTPPAGGKRPAESGATIAGKGQPPGVSPAKAAALSPASQGKPLEGAGNLDLILDVSLKISVQIGSARMVIRDLLQLGQGSVIELEKLADEPMDIYIGEKLVAKGEAVVVNDKFGVRLTDILSPVDRIKQLQKG